MQLKQLYVPLIMMTLCSLANAWAPWRFIVTADSRSESHSDNAGVNVAILTEIVDEVIRQNAEFLCFGGDLCVGKANQTILEEEFLKWRQTVQPLYQAGIPVYAIRGNHDEGTPAGTTAWNNVFKDLTPSGGLNYALPQNGPDGEKNLTYSVTHKNVLILALDQLATPNHGKNRVAQAWIDQQLAANTQPHVFPFGHFTAFKMIWDSFGDYPADRDRFWQSIARAGCRAYLLRPRAFLPRSPRGFRRKPRQRPLSGRRGQSPVPPSISGMATTSATTAIARSPIFTTPPASATSSSMSAVTTLP